MITLQSSRNNKAAIKLHSGATVFPRDGVVRVLDEGEAQELEQKGWTRDAASAKAAAFDRDLLRKAMAAGMRRQPGVGGDFDATARDNTMTMAEFSVSIGREKVRVKRGDNTIVVAGIEVPVGELAPQVQRQLSIATARLDGSSFDIDANLVDLQEARELIGAAIVSVIGDQAFRDRLITAGTKSVAIAGLFKGMVGDG